MSLPTLLFQAVYFFFPAYVANTAACILGHGRPLDLGRHFIDGKRILGDGVTVRGSLAGVLCGTVVGLAQADFDIGSTAAQAGFLLSLGAIVGDGVGSFIKRRLGMPKGAPAPLLDQLNFVVGGLAFARLVLPFGTPPMEPITIAVLFVFTPIAHLMVNKTGYQLKLKDVPW